jgi:amino acid transporter
MVSQTIPRRVTSVSETLARGSLGSFAVVVIVMSAVTPLTVIAGVITIAYGNTGLVGIPVAFVAVALLLALFAVGYVTMGRRIARIGNAGAFYSYISHGLGKPFGVGAGWIALVAYNLLQFGLYGIVGVAAAPLIEKWFGITAPPWYVIAGVAWLITAILGLLQVDVNGKILAVLLLSEVVVITVYSVASLANAAPGGLSAEPFSPDNIVGPGFGALLVAAVLGFIGFESTVIFSEEARDPQRTIAYATYLSIALIAGLYALASWAMSVATGPGNIAQAAQENGPELIFNLADRHLGTWAADVGHTLFVTSVLAAMIAFHNAVSRYMFAIGRERVLPGMLGRTSQRTGAPRNASLLQSLLGAAVIGIYAVAGWDPVTRLFFTAGTAGAVGVLTLITVTSFAVVVFFLRRPSNHSAPYIEAGQRRGEDRPDLWRRLFAPLIAAGILTVVLVLAIDDLANLLGVPPGDPLTWIIPFGFLAVGALGVVWGLVLRATRPDVYARIGLGAKSATATMGGPPPSQFANR